jgi:hypothetical protein
MRLIAGIMGEAGETGGLFAKIIAAGPGEAGEERSENVYRQVSSLLITP